MEFPKLPVTNVVVDGLWEEQYGPYTAEQMQEYARQAVLAERNACINIIHEIALTMSSAARSACNVCAESIRART